MGVGDRTDYGKPELDGASTRCVNVEVQDVPDAARFAVLETRVPELETPIRQRAKHAELHAFTRLLELVGQRDLSNWTQPPWNSSPTRLTRVFRQ